MRMKFLVMLGVVVLMMSCGKKSDSDDPVPAPTETPTDTNTDDEETPPADNPTDVTSNLNRAQTALSAGTPKLDSSGFSLTGRNAYRSGFASTGLEAIWTTEGLVSSPVRVNDTYPLITVKQYMGYVLDDTLLGGLGPITSFKNDMFIFCVLNQYMTTMDDTGQPEDGTYDLTFDLASSKVSENCTGNKDGPQEGTDSATIIVSTLTDTSVFQKKYEIVAASRGGGGQVIYVKTATDGTFNLAAIEPQPGTPDRVSKSMIQINPTQKTIRFESVAHTFDGSSYGLNRIFIDDEAHTGYLLSYFGAMNQNKLFRYAVGGETNSTHAGLAVSLSFKQEGSDYSASDYNACVDDSNGAIKTDDTLTAGSVTLKPISEATVIEANYTAHTTIESYQPTVTSVLPFNTPAEMYTEVTTD